VNPSPLCPEDFIPYKLDTGVLRRLHQFVTGVSALSMGFGLWVLAGWALDLQWMKSILPGQVAVKANTAACFILIGFALWILRREQGPGAAGWRLAAKLAAIVASIVGLLSLLQFLFGSDLGIDQFLFTAGAEDVPGSARPGLMSPIAGFSFFCVGLTLLALDSKSSVARWAAQLLPFCVSIGSMFGILDFVLEPQTTHTYISPVTALVLFLLAFGLLFARTGWGLGALVASAGNGGPLTRRLLPPAIFIPLVIAWLRWKGQGAGLYSTWTGVALMTVTSAVLLSALTAWTGFTVDRSDSGHRRAQQSLAELASIVTSSSDAIFGTTLGGVVTNWNPGAEAMYGYSAEEMIGQSIAVSIPPDHRQDLAAIMEKIGRGEPIERYETTRLRKDGRTINLSISISPVRDRTGRVVGASAIARDVSERKRAEEKLRQASLYTRSLIEASLDPLVTISRDGKITDVNHATESVTGVSRERLIGSDFSDYFTEPEKARQGYEQVFAESRVTDYGLAIRHTSGQVTDVLYNASVFENEAGEIEGVFAAARDITQPKLVEQALRASESRIRLLLDSTAEAIYGQDPAGNCTFCNNATARLLGYEGPADLLGKNMHALMHHSRADGAPISIQECDVTKAVCGGRSYHSDNLVLWRSNGTSFPAECWAHPLVEESQSGGAVVTFLDISERKQAEEELRLSRERLALAQTAGHSGTFDWDMQTNISHWSAEVEEVYGIAPGEFGGTYKDWEALVFPEDLITAKQAIEESLKTGEFASEWRIRRRNDGEIRWITARAKVVYDEAGRPARMLGLNMDVTERKQAQKALLSSERRFRSLVTATAQVVWATDPEGQVEDMPMWRALTGQTVDEVRGAGWLNAVHPEDRASTAEVWAKAVKDRSIYDVEYRIRRNDGQYRHFAVRGVPLLGDDGCINEWVGTCTDITERKQAEEEVRRLNTELEERVIQRTAQLEASNKELEAFTYSVSHDLRAPLRHISGFSKLLTEEFGSTLPPEAQHHLQRIQEGTRRMGLLVDDLLNLGRIGRHEMRLQVTGLTSVVSETLADLKSECEGRQVEWKIGPLPFVECDPGLIKQVFQNLLSNAVKFTRPRSPAVIEVGQKDQEGTPVVFVRDNGVGFNMKYADKLFGVFQRLHRPEDFEGTGVGLATVQRIIQKHGGRIWVESALDKGATFYFTLGISEKTEPKMQAAIAGGQI
jgi:PAS domain S-box-containing protein